MFFLPKQVDETLIVLVQPLIRLYHLKGGDISNVTKNWTTCPTLRI